MKKTIGVKYIFISFMIILIFTACTGKEQTTKRNLDRIAIAEQYGLAYAPLQIMKELKILEKNSPEIEIIWKKLGNTAAIREAMLAHEVDVGFMAIPPFLIGWDKGMKWKIASGLSVSPVGLVTYKEDIKSIKDFTEKDRIALPQPGSVQHILLSMACEEEFGDASQLDNLLVTLAHPDGMTALLAQKDITAHFTTPPYLFKELDSKEMHQVLDGKEIMGKDFTFIVGVSTETFHDRNTSVYNAFIASLEEAILFMQNNPKKSAALLSKVYHMPEEELLRYLTWDGVQYDPTVKGIDEFATFMLKHGYLSQKPQSIHKILWENVQHEK
ncbi:ABC transporter substrate-binding protein [Clostridiaceae bacterium 35-E11]